MKQLIILTLLLALAGCAPTLTKEGAQVRKINLQIAKDCNFLGFVIGEWTKSFSYNTNVHGAYVDLRNKVAAKGGNCFVTTTETNFSVQADVYHCDLKNASAKKN